MAGFMFGQALYRALAPLVVVRWEGLEGWQDAYVYQGQFLPTTSDPFQLEALFRDGLIEKFEGTTA
jgi:hypothetical protein